MIEVRNISKLYKKKLILNDVSLIFDKPEFVLITGESGCGKTTLLNILCGIEKPDNGYIEVDGRKPDFNYFSYLSQNRTFISNETVYYNLKEAIAASKKVNDINEEIDKLLLLVNLNKSLVNRVVSSLSSGEQARLALAIALAKDCQCLILDEATDCLDYDNCLLIYSLLKRISKDRLVLLITHDVNNAKKFADRMININKGIVYSDESILTVNDDCYSYDTNEVSIIKRKIDIRFRIDYLFYIVFFILFVLIFSNLVVRNNPYLDETMNYPNYVYKNLYIAEDEENYEEFQSIMSLDKFEYLINSYVFRYPNGFIDYSKNYDTIISGATINNSNEVLVSQKYSEKNDCKLGDTIQSHFGEFIIVGIVKSKYSVLVIDQRFLDEYFSYFLGKNDYSVKELIERHLIYYDKYICYNKDSAKNVGWKYCLATDYYKELTVKENIDIYNVSLAIPIIVLLLLILFYTIMLTFNSSNRDETICFYRILGLNKRNIRKKMAKNMYGFKMIMYSVLTIILSIIILIVTKNRIYTFYRFTLLSYILAYISSLALSFLINELKFIYESSISLKRIIK
ncbi:MAG: ATP-binding cassette domain-containing protein [Anaeroplasma sp.]